MRQLLRINEVAEALAVSETTVRAMIDDGHLAPAIKVGGNNPRWRREDIDEYLVWAKIEARVKECQEKSGVRTSPHRSVQDRTSSTSEENSGE